MMISSNLDIFQSEEESAFFSKCIEKLLFSKTSLPNTILELGCGDGQPVIDALKNLDIKKRPKVYGYEICEKSYTKLLNNINNSKMQDFYIVYNKPFFEQAFPTCDFLISNPPYLPHIGNISYPNLSGGLEGNSISKSLLDTKIKNILLIVSSYSNPKDLISYANFLGYKIVDFLITDVKFEKYSKEPEVLKQINRLKEEGKAFLLNKDSYRIAGVFFSLSENKEDKSLSFIETFLS